MRNGNPDVHGRDLAGGQELPIAATPATEAYPDCDGSRVVYMRNGASSDIYIFDRTTGATTPVSTQPWHEWQPAISGSRVVWQALASEATRIDILGVDLNTDTPVTVTTAVGDQTIPDISGTLVVWPSILTADPKLGGDGQRPGTPDLRTAGRLATAGERKLGHPFEGRVTACPRATAAAGQCCL
jgi:hypothetical protein